MRALVCRRTVIRFQGRSSPACHLEASVLCRCPSFAVETRVSFEKPRSTAALRYVASSPPPRNTSRKGDRRVLLDQKTCSARYNARLRLKETCRTKASRHRGATKLVVARPNSLPSPLVPSNPLYSHRAKGEGKNDGLHLPCMMKFRQNRDFCCSIARVPELHESRRKWRKTDSGHVSTTSPICKRSENAVQYTAERRIRAYKAWRTVCRLGSVPIARIAFNCSWDQHRT